MQRRGGGGGGAGGNGGNAQAARQFFLSLFGGAVGGGGQNRGRSYGDSRGGRRLGSGARPRDGEWMCQCGFGTNRAYREACHQCGRARDVAEVSGNAGTKGGKGLGKRWTTEGRGHGGVHTAAPSMGKGSGPVGAGGTRPLLGGRGRGPLWGTAGGGLGKGCTGGPGGGGKGPSTSGPAGKAEGWGKAGHSSNGKGAAKAYSGGKADGDGTTGADGRSQCGPVWKRPPTVLDDDGYELVQPRRIRAEKGGPKGDAGATTTKGGGDGGTYASVVRRRWADEDASDD